MSYDAIERLSFGEFIGARRRTAVAAGFCFAEIANLTGEQVPLHSHDDAHFVFVVRGTYATSARRADALCGPTTLLFNPSGTTHRDRFVTPTGAFLAISVAASRLGSIEQGIEAVEHPVALGNGWPTWLARKIWRELRALDHASPLVLEGLAVELLGWTVRTNREPERSVPPWLRRASEMIEDRCTESVTVGKIAAAVGVHPYHLSRTFRAFFHQSPGEYLRECRVRRATELLCRTRLPLSQIAIQCGYAGQSEFARSFRRHTGLTPRQVRNV